MTAIKNKPIILIILVAFLTAAFFTSCSAPGHYFGSVDSVMEDRDMGPYHEIEERAIAEEALGTNFEDTKVLDERVGDSRVRHVIRTGSIDLTVTDTREKISEVRGIVEASDGMISSSNIYEVREGRYGANLTLRVPNSYFDRVMEQLEELGTASNVQTGTDDVTMQYIDLESRLNNQKAQEERLVEILEMAETVEEVLEVERELYRVRGEVETMTAQLNHLEDRVSYSTIYLNLREEAISTEVISPNAFENLGGRIEQAFIGSINFILNGISVLIIILSALLPILIILGVVVLIVVLLVRRVSRRKKAAVEKAGEEKAEVTQS